MSKIYSHLRKLLLSFGGKVTLLKLKYEEGLCRRSYLAQPVGVLLVHVGSVADSAVLRHNSRVSDDERDTCPQGVELGITAFPAPLGHENAEVFEGPETRSADPS